MIAPMGTFCPSFRHLSNQNRSQWEGMHMKLNFRYFQIKTWMWQIELKTGRRNWVHLCFVSMFSSWVVILKLAKILFGFFCNFVLISAKTSKSDKLVCICASESSQCTFLGSNVVFSGLSVWLRKRADSVLISPEQ